MLNVATRLDGSSSSIPINVNGDHGLITSRIEDNNSSMGRKSATAVPKEVAKGSKTPPPPKSSSSSSSSSPSSKQPQEFNSNSNHHILPEVEQEVLVSFQSLKKAFGGNALEAFASPRNPMAR